MSSSWEDELEESNYHVRLYCVGREEEVHLMSKEASLVHDAKTASSLDSVEEASSSLQCSFSDSLEWEGGAGVVEYLASCVSLAWSIVTQDSVSGEELTR